MLISRAVHVLLLHSLVLLLASSVHAQAVPVAVMELDEGGQIINSNGLTDTKAWGQAAPWVDYSGMVDGQRLGIAILNHPSSFRFPTHWHVRTYGLFAANPFGLRDFMVVSAYTYVDFDRDGDLDIVTNAVGGPLRVYRNNEARHGSLSA